MGIPAQKYAGASGIPPAGDMANAVLSGVFTAVGPSQPFGFQGYANFAIWCAFKSALTTTAGSLSSSVASAGLIAAGESINSTLVPPGTTVGAISGTGVTLSLPALTMYATLLSNGQIVGLPSTQWLQGATVTGPNVPAGTIVDAIVTQAVPQPSFPGGAPILGTVQLSNLPAGALPAVNTPVAFTFALAAAGIAAGTDNAATFTGSDIVLATTAINIERSFDGGFTWIPCNIGSTGTLAQYNSGPINASWIEPERGVLYRFNCVSLGATAGITLNYRMSQSAGAAMALTTGGVV